MRSREIKRRLLDAGSTIFQAEKKDAKTAMELMLSGVRPKTDVRLTGVDVRFNGIDSDISGERGLVLHNSIIAGTINVDFESHVRLYGTSASMRINSRSVGIRGHTALMMNINASHVNIKSSNIDTLNVKAESVTISDCITYGEWCIDADNIFVESCLVRGAFRGDLARFSDCAFGGYFNIDCKNVEYNIYCRGLPLELEGELYAYKVLAEVRKPSAENPDITGNVLICRVRIPKSAKRVMDGGVKMRVSKLELLTGSGISPYYWNKLYYAKGKTLETHFSPGTYACGDGLHVFLSRQTAISYAVMLCRTSAQYTCVIDTTRKNKVLYKDDRYMEEQEEGELT